MTAHVSKAAVVPRSVSLFSSILRFLLIHGVPLGPNALVTIPGRTTGVPRTTPLALIDASGRRWVWSPWGDVHWVRNLRAAARATITFRRQTEVMTARELDADERIAFFRDVLAPLARSIPFGVQFIRIVDGVDITDPVAAAEGRVVFELQPVR